MEYHILYVWGSIKLMCRSPESEEEKMEEGVHYSLETLLSNYSHYLHRAETKATTCNNK